MPVYNYECECGRSYERVYKITKFPKTIKCECGKRAKKVISEGIAAQLDGDVPWLSSACEVLQPAWERPLETRGEYNRYLKDRNIQPKC